MIYTPEVVRAQARVELAVLQAITADRYTPEGEPDADAVSEYADEVLMRAARDLVQAVNALPADARPVGWDDPKETDV